MESYLGQGSGLEQGQPWVGVMIWVTQTQVWVRVGVEVGLGPRESFRCEVAVRFVNRISPPAGGERCRLVCICPKRRPNLWSLCDWKVRCGRTGPCPSIYLTEQKDLQPSKEKRFIQVKKKYIKKTEKNICYKNIIEKKLCLNDVSTASESPSGAAHCQDSQS